MSRAVRILDIEPDLGADLDGEAFDEARAAVTAPVVWVDAGTWDPHALTEHPDVRGRLFGCLVHEGLSVRGVHLADRNSTQLFGPGDLITTDGEASRSLPLQTHHQAPEGISVALLDDRFLAACRRWPRLIARLVDVAAEQLDRAAVHQAISQLPRVEDRLLALFWLLADRWARVGPAGVTVRLPLTHEALGHLIGARRPTVSLGLRDLAEHRTLSRLDDGEWLLDTESLTVLESGADPEQVRAVMRRRQREPAASLPASAPEPVQPSPERDALLRRVAALREQLGIGRERTEASLTRNRDARERLATFRAMRAQARETDPSLRP